MAGGQDNTEICQGPCPGLATLRLLAAPLLRGICTHIDTKQKTYRIGSHFLWLYAHMPKEITFYVFWGEKRDPSKIYANSNLRNLTHITQKPSYVYTFFTYTLKEITALQLTYFSNLFFFNR